MMRQRCLTCPPIAPVSISVAEDIGPHPPILLGKNLAIQASMKPRRILVPLDGQRASESALSAAIELARESGGRLYLLRVLETSASTAGAAVRHRAAVQRAERYLAATRQRLASAGVRDVSTGVWSGSPAAAIVKAADLTDADMIVIASGGGTGPPRGLTGSVAERVLRGTRRPVLVITPANAIVDASLGDAVPLPDRPAPTRPSSVPAAPRTPDERRPSPEATYREALDNLQQQEQEVLHMVKIVQDAAKSLERWPAVHVAHSGAGFPKEVTMVGRVIDGSLWPTAAQLGDTLAAWHSAAEAARVAWAHVPREARPTLPPPP